MAIVALCIAGVLAGCGSVTNGLAFQAPAGWTGTPAMFGHLQMWMKNGRQKDSMQMVMLVKGNVNKDGNEDLSMVPPQYSKDMKTVQKGDTKLCGKQPAQQMIAEGTDKDGKHTRVEVISTVIGTDRYIAMYIRPSAMPADPMAESAIHSLCPLK
jgi:hypothetical protein